MNSGNTGSPTLLESTSEDSEDVHPVDAVIQAAISRQQSPVSGAASKDRVGKRKREVLATSDVISLRSSSESHSSASDEYNVDRHPALPPQSQAVPASGIAPVGVTVVEEGSQTRNAEVQRLLRGGRYFDANTEELGPACFRCGERGHTQYTCKNQRKQAPCSMCAQYGHQKNQCPSMLCFKCKKPGHIARDCPNPAFYQGSKICLRCGKSKCAAAGMEDYHRAEGACTQDYHDSDLALVRCYTCNRMGHLCCKAAPQDPPEPSCHNCGEEGHLAADCQGYRPQQVNMERQFDTRQRHLPPSQTDTWSHDCWPDRARPAGGFDRWSSGNPYGAYHGVSMAVGNGYASRVNALHERTQGRDPYVTPREQTAPRGGGKRYYPGSEKIHGPQHDRYDNGYDDYQPEYVGARTLPAGRWRR